MPKKSLKRTKLYETKTGIAVLEPNMHDISGVIHFYEEPDKKGMKITYDIKGMKDGEHGFHIHEYGDLTNGCVSAGPHFNPFHNVHGGLDSPSTKRHLGDLGNITAKDGKSKGTLYAPYLTLTKGKTAILGRMIVVHAYKDDLGLGEGAKKKQSLISGNAGERLTCGIIALSK